MRENGGLFQRVRGFIKGGTHGIDFGLETFVDGVHPSYIGAVVQDVPASQPSVPIDGGRLRNFSVFVEVKKIGIGDSGGCPGHTAVHARFDFFLVICGRLVHVEEQTIVFCEPSGA